MPSLNNAFTRINTELTQIPGRISLLKCSISITPFLLPHFFSISISLSYWIFFPLNAGFSIFFNFKIQFFATQVNLKRFRKRLSRDECDIRAYRKWYECSSRFPVYLRQFVLHLHSPIFILSIASKTTELRLYMKLRSLFTTFAVDSALVELSKIYSRD